MGLKIKITRDKVNLLALNMKHTSEKTKQKKHRKDNVEPKGTQGNTRNNEYKDTEEHRFDFLNVVFVSGYHQLCEISASISAFLP